MTDAEVRAALTDYDVLWLTIAGEAESEPIEGKVFVGSVIRNRVRLGTFGGHDVKGVCLKPKQFSCWNPGPDKNHQRLMARARLVVDDYAIASTRTPEQSIAECRWVAEGILTGALRDRAQGCDHYLTVSLWKTRPPSWARGPHRIIVGAHVGFRLSPERM